MKTPLYERIIEEQIARNDAALLAIASRRNDIQRLALFVSALSARGWKARATVATGELGAEMVCTLYAWLDYSTTAELTEALMWITGNGVTLTRNSEHDSDRTRRYRANVDDTELHLVALIEARAAKLPAAA